MTNGISQPSAAIQLVDINKRFGAVHANKDINLTINKGTIHGIVGENGAGKSTLMSIIYGFYQADSGQILVDGKEVKITDSRAAISHGIGMVHQHFKLVENFTVLENVMLGAEGGALLGTSRRQVKAELQRIAAEYELQVDPSAIIEELPVGLQQRVEILKALYRKAQILILDEPTGVLTPTEADHLFGILRRLRDEGKTVVLITHKLREIMAATDAVSVMRRGELIQTSPTADVTTEQIAEAMVGRRVLLRVNKPEGNPGAVVLDVANLNVRDARGVLMVKDLSFSVRAGEIVGIAGVAGNGQTELLEALAGTRVADSGVVMIDGQVMPQDPSILRAAGLAHVPEDRHATGLILPFTMSENASLGYHRRPEFGTGPMLDKPALRENAERYIRDYDVRPPHAEMRASMFSGGNQQKIVLAREIEHNPKALLVGQPTRGVDIGAIEFIHRRLIELRQQQKAILLVSVELDEIRALADRILVMFDGRIVGEASPDATETELGLLMAGVSEDKVSEGVDA
jgi:simple sugar transport system ATP-binding protein